MIQRACAQLFPELDSGRGGSSPSPGLAVYTRRSFPPWEPRTTRRFTANSILIPTKGCRPGTLAATQRAAPGTFLP